MCAVTYLLHCRRAARAVMLAADGARFPGPVSEAVVVLYGCLHTHTHTHTHTHAV